MGKQLNIQVSTVYERNERSKARYLVNKGGSRSTKSWSIAQLLIRRFWNEKNKKTLVTRKTGPALHLTAYRLVVDLLRQYGLYATCSHDKTYNIITNPHNGSMFAFLSIDDPEKIKSTEWNYIWMEEATEFTWDDFLICQTRLSGPTTADQRNQIILSFNPTDENGWIEQKLILAPSLALLTEVIHSTYHDNPFLSAEYISILEGLKQQDDAAYRIFALGEYGLLTEVIYSPYEIVKEFPASFDEVIYGLDFGFNNPSAFMRIGIKDGQNAYLQQIIYQTHLTNSQLIDKIRQTMPKPEWHCQIYADCAEPARIEEIRQAGFQIVESDKEVKVGIDFSKRFKFYAMAESVDLLKERSSYKWRKDKNGYVLEEPVKFMDHCMDAKRYAIYTRFKSEFAKPAFGRGLVKQMNLGTPAWL